jgi:transposase InsO family protein
MREDNLLCLRRRKFVVTTDSNHSRPVYPNLARGMVLTDVNQRWVADLTSIRLETEFVYLAVVLVLKLDGNQVDRLSRARALLLRTPASGRQI